MVDSNILCDFRKKCLGLIYVGYTTYSICLGGMTWGISHFENIYAVVWMILLCVYFFVKGLYILLYEMRGIIVSLLKYTNMCEYVLFIVGNILLFSNDYNNEPISIDGLGWVVMLMWNMFAVLAILLIIIAILCECCGYNTHLKYLFLNIFEFEIVVLPFVTLFGIFESIFHLKILTEELLPEHGSTT